jgi:hypothetical protein
VSLLRGPQAPLHSSIAPAFGLFVYWLTKHGFELAPAASPKIRKRRDQVFVA